MSKKRYVFDIETNGFLPDVNKIWMLVLINPDTNEVKSYTSKSGHVDSVIEEGLAELDTADVIIGHNIIGYDIPVLNHLCGWKPKDHQQVVDTWIMSQTNQYKRKHKHGLEGWGHFFNYPKLPFDKFDEYSDEMLTYCIRDVELNVKVYKELIKEASGLIKKNPLYAKGLQVEMDFARIESDIRQKGWMFDMAKAQSLLTEINNKLEAIESVLEPRIGMQCIKVDRADEFKTPAWRKDGCYTSATVKHFGYDQECGRTTRPIEGPYCRVSFEQGKVGSIEVVKSWLYSLGWVPDEWNVEKINGQFVNKSPKLTESSLEPLGADAMLVSEYYTIRSRKGILEGWIEAVKNSPDNRLHGRMWTIGTPTFRCRHEVVANIPAVDSVYGKEMRSLLICEPGTSIVGADSAGNQMRGLCHYIGNDEFTNEVINGDVHQRNADALGTTRKLAKPFLYAFLFGGGAGKLGLILTGKRDAKVGQQAIDKFQDSVPGLKELKDTLERQYNATTNAFGNDFAFVRGLDGRLVFAASKHQLLNYILQTTEGITCKAAIVWLEKELKKRNIPFYFTLHYHDELAVVVKDEYAEEVAELSIKAFTEAPKDFGVMCMGGDAHVGKTYAEVH